MSITGSGAHGIIATMPLYAAYKVQGYAKEQLLRATALSYLVCMYIKEYSGKLSAFCGCAIAAGTGNGQPPRPCRPAPAARRAFPASAPESPENRPRRAVPAALRCGSKGGSNPWAVPAGDRGPLSCEFSQNSGVGVSPKKSKSAALFRTAVCIENGAGQAHACHLDYIIPHRGDMRLFWDESNWQALCESCHDHKIWHGL